MSRGWLVVILLGAATAAIKAAGPLLLGARPLPSPLLPVLRFMPPAVFAGLIVVQSFGRGQALTLDARAFGLATAAVGAALRAPAPIVLLASVAVTAALRQLLR